MFCTIMSAFLCCATLCCTLETRVYCLGHSGIFGSFFQELEVISQKSLSISLYVRCTVDHFDLFLYHTGHSYLKK